MKIFVCFKSRYYGKNLKRMKINNLDAGLNFFWVCKKSQITLRLRKKSTLTKRRIERLKRNDNERTFVVILMALAL